MFLLYTAGLAYSLWIFYILVMGLYRAKLNNRLSKAATVFGAPFLLIGYILDVVSNLTIASVILMEWPKEALVTTRLRRHLSGSKTWRYHIAKYICDSLLDPFDPRGSHCL